MYTGLGTPSEAAALGVLATVVLALATRQLNWPMLRDSLDGAVRTTCMIVTILVSAAFMSSAMAYLHVPASIAQGIAALEVGPYSLMLLLMLFYLLLGMFLEGISILVMSLPITLPLVLAQGWDPIWFGVFLVIAIELGQVTPPVGFNLFVIQGLTGQPIARIALASAPFFLLLLLTAVIITLFPQIALFLPDLLYG
ncbi:MAG: TRAP transporter large permease subunit [Burkholderiaceae bacterium]